MIYGGVLLAVAMAAVPGLASPSTLVIVPFMFLLSMGLSGIAAVLNLFSGGGDRYWVFAEGMQVAMLGLSTVFYPEQAMQAYLPAFAVEAVTLNPLSQVAGALRGVSPAGFGASSLALMALTSLLLLAVGFVSYRHVFLKVRLLGKVQ